MMEIESNWDIPCWSSVIAEITNRDLALVMNSLPSSPAGQTPNQSHRWLLEIVRGRDVGRTFALDPGETVVGNALNGQSGLDLHEQEGSSPRRMAARQATLECEGQGLSIRDLESPGGTFVNQQRLLAGQSRKLVSGDVIQLGGVQLKVKPGATTASPAAAPAAAAASKAPAATVAAPQPRAVQSTPTAGRPKGVPDAKPPPPEPRVAAPASPTAAAAVAPRPAQQAAGGKLATAFVLANGAQCRSWDDFLVHSAQSWSQVREELTSGRLIEYLRRIGRPDLIPHAAPDRSPDDRLDEWLARLPVNQSSAPELDVHPETLLVQAKTGGGVARLSLRITNVGFRLLRSTLRIEPADARWVRLLAGQDGRAFQTIDQTEIPVEIELPETIDRLLRALIVIESNGGVRRVEVRVERPADPLLTAEPGADFAASEFPIVAKQLGRRLAHVGLLARVVVCIGAAAGLRLLFALMNAMPFGGAGSTLAEPRITSVALITAVVGVFSGLILARRRGEPRDLLTAGLAGGVLGLLSSALWFAVMQGAERALGSWSTSIAAVCLLWGAAGAMLALLSTIFVPYRPLDRQVSP
jgi:FHA domain